MPLNTQSILTCEKDEITYANLIFLCEYGGIYNRNVLEDVISVKINRCETPVNSAVFTNKPEHNKST